MTTKKLPSHVRAEQLLARAAQLRDDERLDAAELAIAQAVALLGSDASHSDNAVLATLEQAVVLQLRLHTAQAEKAFAKAIEQLGIPKRGDGEARLVLHVRAHLGRAAVMRDLGRLRDSDRLSTRALKLAEQRLGKRHLVTAEALNTLGVLRKAQGRYADALRVYRRALPIFRKEGEVSHDLASLYHNLGGIEHARGRFVQAEPWARKSVVMRRALLGPRNVIVAADEAALAAVLESLGKFEEADRLYRSAVAVFRRKQGEGSWEVAFNLANHATLLQRWGKTKAAERGYRVAIPRLRSSGGPRHPQLALMLNNFAVLLGAQGRWREALQQLRRACAIARAVLPAQHPHRLLFEHNERKMRASAA